MLLRAFLVQLPLALLLTGVVVELVQMALAVTDVFSDQVLASAGVDTTNLLAPVAEFLGGVGAVNLRVPAFVVFAGGLLVAVAALGLWLELVASHPLVPRSGYLRRAVLAALAMWTFWILAYVLGLSNHAFYRNFAHVPGGLSAAADQQIATAVLWFVAAAAFVPVIFWNAMMWLRTDEDPDAELLALERAERRRGTPPLTERQDGGTANP